LIISHDFIHNSYTLFTADPLRGLVPARDRRGKKIRTPGVKPGSETFFGGKSIPKKAHLIGAQFLYASQKFEKSTNFSKKLGIACLSVNPQGNLQEVWVFGHPEVYILILPGFALVTVNTDTNASTQTFGMVGMLNGIITIAVLGFIVWAHHMYTTGNEADTVVYFGVATMAIAIPSGIKILHWLTVHA